MTSRRISILVIAILLGAYLSITRVRLLPLLIILIILGVLGGALKYKKLFLTKSLSFIFFIVIILFTTIISLYQGSYNIVISTFLFGVLAYWPLVISKANQDNKLFISAHNSYILSGLIIALGLFLQNIIYTKYNYSFGYINIYGGNRIAYGFLWSDFSFLSLYLVSCIPLLYSSHHSYRVKSIVTLILFSASLATSARTGIAAIILTYSLYFVINLHKLIIKRRFYLYVAIAIILLVSLYLLQQTIGLIQRDLSMGGSGRIEGYLKGIHYFLNNFWIGAKFDQSYYAQAIDTIPHNLFIFSATMGGAIYLTLVCLWMISLTIEVFKTKETTLQLSYFICLIGFQFIPSLFSAYFFAVLISIILLFRRTQKSS